MSEQWEPLSFDMTRAILRWHDKGRPWSEQDLRVDTFIPGAGAKTQPVCVLHFPTGARVEGIGKPDDIIEALRESLGQAADHLARVRAASLN